MSYLKTVGKFDCVVEKPNEGWIGEQGENQTPFVRIPLVVEDGENAGETITFKGWLSAKAFPHTTERINKVFGFDVLAHIRVGKGLEGLRCNIQTDFETYNGKEFLKIKWLNPIGSGGAKPMDANRINAIIDSLRGNAKPVQEDPFA